MAQIASLTLYHNDEARPIIEAIIADNPGVRVLNMPGCVKLDCDGQLVVKRASVEERLGRDLGPAGNPSRAHFDGRQSRRRRRPVHRQLETLEPPKIFFWEEIMTAKKLGLKQRYAHLTRGLDWETTYQPMDKVFPYDQFEGIKIKDWSPGRTPSA